ncbi:MFS transporter [uncultured Paludibaculum sp.]|uniref:MFS transporter n=1 Tax=uncultured Paludibaculum sp. TaxID=1765020 RepID=UPI002AAAFB48|nr:MFS transporter [uncultured Paludibaculum sp.]
MLGKGLRADPDFLKLWVGQAISQIGSNITGVGLPLTAVVVLRASPLQMGFLAGASAAPVLVLGLFAGAWADRLRRRPLLIAADLGRAAVLGTIPLLAVLHRLTIEHLYVVAAASGILTVLFDVSYQAYLPSLIARENILEGNSKLASTESLAEIAGPGFTGILVQLITAPMAMLFDAASFVCSAISLWLIRKPEPRPTRPLEPSIGREISEGLRASWRNPLLRALVGRTATGAFFLGFGSSLYFLFVMRELGLTAALLGIIVSVGGTCGLFGTFMAEWLVHRFGFGATFIGSVLVIGVAMLLVPLAHGSVAVCSAFLIVSQMGDLAWPVYNINDRSLRQAITPDHLLGRVNAAIHLVYHGALPLGALTGGAVAQAIGIRQTLLIGALGFLLSTLWLVFSPARRLRELPHAVDETRV